MGVLPAEPPELPVFPPLPWVGGVVGSGVCVGGVEDPHPASATPLAKTIIAIITANPSFFFLPFPASNPTSASGPDQGL